MGPVFFKGKFCNFTPMLRRCIEFPLPHSVHSLMLEGTRVMEPAMVLYSNRESGIAADRFSSYDLLAAFGAVDSRSGNSHCLPAMRNFMEQQADWTFLAVSYDLKNELEDLSSSHPDRSGFPLYHVFRPRYVVTVDAGSLTASVHYLPSHDDAASVTRFFTSLTDAVTESPSPADEAVNIKARLTREEYLETVDAIRNKIRLGDLYEMNFCMEFYAENAAPDPVLVYRRLGALSPMPFSCYYRSGSRHLLCASPERFLYRRGQQLVSQPIKGTAPRGRTTEEDRLQKDCLRSDEKERAENVMIVDLVRNDLSRIALPGTVAAEELFRVVAFPALHQMISTVTAAVSEDTGLCDILEAAFPMGSMTGAPKVSAMMHIEQYERTRRGLYSGTVGYVTPAGDFDLNVVIRSMTYNAASHYLSLMAGSAITAGCDPQREYEECLLKAQTMMKALGHV